MNEGDISVFTGTMNVQSQNSDEYERMCMNNFTQSYVSSRNNLN